jgi:PAS domain S-box-containing protein
LSQTSNIPAVIKTLDLDLTDRAAIISRLKESGLSVTGTSAKCKESFVAALNDFQPDLIFADCTLNVFGAEEAIDILKEKELSVPVIIITAAENESKALSLIGSGAEDYILREHSGRLPVAVSNALEKHKLKKEKQAEAKQLQQKEQRYNSLLENSEAGEVILSADGKPLHVSPSVKKILGYTEEEVMQMHLLTVTHPDDLSAFTNALEKAIAGPGIPVKGGATRIKHKDGSWRRIDRVLTNMLHVPSIAGIVDNFRDITEWKIAEEKVRYVQRLNAFISQINQTTVQARNEQGVFKEACRVATQIGKFKAAWVGMINEETQQINIAAQAGLSEDDFAKLSVVMFGDDGPQSNVLRTGKYYVCNNIAEDPLMAKWKDFAESRDCRSGIVLPLKKEGVAIGTFNLYSDHVNSFTEEEIGLLAEATNDISFAIDVFEKEKRRHISDENLRHSERRLQQTQSIAGLGNWELDFSTGVAMWSPEMLRIYGLPPEETKQSRLAWLSAIHPDDFNYVSKLIKEAVAAKKNTSFFHKIIRPDGSIRHIHSHARIEKDSAGNAVGLYGVGHDVTEIKKAEDALRESEANLKAIFENTSEGFLLADASGKIKAFNNKAKEIIFLNSEKEITAGAVIFDFIDLGKENNYKESLSKVFAGDTLKYDQFFSRKNGKIKWYQFTVNPVRNDRSIEGISITFADITERKTAEQLHRMSESNLNAIIENTDAFIYSLDRNFRYITFNSALQKTMFRLYGINIVPGYHVFDFINKFDAVQSEEWRGIYTRALKGEAIKFEKYFFNNNVHSCSAFSIHPIRENNTVIGLSCFVNDITAEKEILERSRFKANLLNTIGQAAVATDINGIVNYWNRAAEEIYGWAQEEALGKSVVDLIPLQITQADANEVRQQLLLENSWSGECIMQHKNGFNFPAFVTNSPVYDQNNNLSGIIGISSDISEKKGLESLLERTNLLARIGNWEINLSDKKFYWSKFTKQLHEVEDNFVPTLKAAIDFCKPGRGRERLKRAINEAVKNNKSFDLEAQIVTARGRECWVRIIGEAECRTEVCHRVYGSIQDIDKVKKAELNVLDAHEEKRVLLESIGDAFFALDKSWVVTYWNKMAESLLTIPKEKVLGKNIWEVFPEHVNSKSYQNYHRALKTQKISKYENFYEALDKWFEISAYPSETGLSVFFKDITERKVSDLKLLQLNEQLQKQTRDLAVSNKELEDFAYVASHDLQEPLRMVTGFLGQIEKKYSNIIDDRGRQYIHFAVDGAKRMRRIILDLLEFSRIGRMKEKEERIDLNELVAEIIVLSQTQIRDADAIIIPGKLPSLISYKAPVRQVFQNLISNALKYHNEHVQPVINISAEETEEGWQFSIADNGIGIEEEYYNRIFLIFQRLHNKDEYSGTGIGLAICKKIIENFGGKIWVQSEYGVGTTFYFTLRNINTN